MEKKLSLNILRTPPFTPFIGPNLNLDTLRNTTRIEKIKKIISAMVDYLENYKYHIIFLSLNRDIIDTMPFIWKKYKVTPLYTYIIDLNLTETIIWNNMTTERRKNINKSLKDNLTVEKTYDYTLAKELILKTFLRQNKKIDTFYLDKILFNFAQENNSFCFITYLQEKPISAAFCLYDSHTAYYLLGGYDTELKHHGAGALALWKAILYAQELGLKSFDFEGSVVPSIEQFFRGFGGNLVPYFSVTKALLPLEIILKFFKREWF
jgi:lipid II:glycine glycyltransferase (peptidoglycan interpeptide bridge formation enzyme)